MATTAAATTRGRQARPLSGPALPTGVWRLLLLAGLAWCGLLLLGGTAHADACDATSCATERRTVPLIDQVGVLAGTVAPGLPTDELTTSLPTVVAVSDPVIAAASDVLQVPAVAAPAPLEQAPAAHVAEVVADTTTDPVDRVDRAAAKVVVPSLTATVVPTMAAASTPLEALESTVITQVEQFTSPVPLPVLTDLVDRAGDASATLTDIASDVLVSAAVAADTVVEVTTASTAPALAALTGPAGSVVVTTASASAADTPGSHAASSTATATGTTPVPGGPSAASGVVLGEAIGGPAVPPPDGGLPTAAPSVQPAPAAVTTLPVPASGAGSTATGAPASGPGSSSNSPTAGLPPVYVGRADTLALAPVEGPVRPMPGTPLDDPGFSPD